jgi:hypothetical protein
MLSIHVYYCFLRASLSKLLRYNLEILTTQQFQCFIISETLLHL